MLLHEKLDLFYEDKLFLNAIDVSKDYAIDILESRGLLHKVLLEKNIGMESPILATTGNNNFFGAYSYINSGGYIRSNVFIGRYCSIGRRVTISAGEHSIQKLSSHPLLCPVESNEIKNKKTVIQSDVWIGDGAVIMPGITIGKGAIIGANAVVTKDVYPYEIVGGVPAKRIRMRFSDEIIDRLVRCNWEEYSMDLLKSYIKSGATIEGIVECLEQLDMNDLVYFPTYRLL